jgi:hypothetical protein
MDQNRHPEKLKMTRRLKTKGFIRTLSSPAGPKGPSSRFSQAAGEAETPESRPIRNREIYCP